MIIVKTFVLFMALVAVSLQPVIGAEAVSPTNPQIGQDTAQQIALLKAQLEATHHYEAQLISIVLWSLGSVVAVAIGLTAFNWYSNRIAYERELNALTNENKAMLAELRAQVQSGLESKASVLIEKLNERQASIEKAVEASLNKNLGKVSERVTSCTKRLTELEYNDTERQAEEAVRSGGYAWAIYQYAELIKISIRQGSAHYQATEIIDEIRKILDDHKPELSASNVSHAVESLQKLSGSEAFAANGLIELINQRYQAGKG